VLEYVLLSIALAWSGIQFGTLWIMQTSILPLLNGLPADRYPDTCQRIDMHFFHPIALWGGVAVMLVGVALTTMLTQPAARVTAGLAALMMLAVGVISEGKNRPIWRMIEKWTPATLPDNWEQLRHTWKNAHALRTAAAFLAVVLFATTTALEFGQLA
jgi:hypothetical protein